ncbi:MAG TPA: hypothetical protein VHP33_07565 [Polyangiaceae bacterium]|nr:hypothetical protein [Polyangiaceae bacterium]
MLPTFSTLRGATLVLGVGLGLSLASACSKDDAADSDARPSAGAAGEAAVAGAGVAGSALSGDAGGRALGGAAGAEPGADAGSAGMEAGGAPSAGSVCSVVLSMNTSNAADAETPLRETCRASTFDGQINFEVVEGAPPNGRAIQVDFFAPPVAGASVKLEDGYDFATHEGAAASYSDSVGVWNADSGTVSIETVTGDTYVVKLVDVHFAVLPGQPVEPTTMGEFVANGTITASAEPAK